MYPQIKFFKCIVKTNRLCKVTGSHVYCTTGKISVFRKKGVQTLWQHSNSITHRDVNCRWGMNNLLFSTYIYAAGRQTSFLSKTDKTQMHIHLANSTQCTVWQLEEWLRHKLCLYAIELHDKTTIILSRSLYRSICVSWHIWFRT